MIKDCLYCGASFEPKKPKQKFCSSKCRVYFNREEISEGGFIYCLRNPLDNNNVFYVGKTIISLSKRLSGHIQTSKRESDAKSKIIKEIINAGEDVVIEQLEVFPGDSLKEIEAKLTISEKAWIEAFSKNLPISNKTYNPKANKTNPIGVRFRVDLLERLKTEHGVDSPQKALVFYERFFVTWWELGKNVKFPLRKAAEAASAIPPIDDIEPKDRIKATAPAATKPKTLDELKSLCPANLTGWDRSEWIRAERQKYGI